MTSRSKPPTSALALALALVLASCGEPAKPGEQAAALGGQIAARVGAEAVPVTLVAAVAAEQHVTPREALHRIVDDAIAAESARMRGLDRSVPASWLLVAARARFTADRLLAEARAKGPPTDDEVRALSKLHWREVDRPPSIHVEHVVVLRPKNGDVAAARALAHTVHDAVVGAANGEAFLAAAKAVPHAKELDIRAEDLPAFIEDGGVVGGGGSMDETFAKAAFGIAKLGDTSDVVETPFGWHVIRLLERLPEQRVPFEERRAAFQGEVIARRAHEALEARLAALQGATPVSIASDAEQLMRGVRASAP
jgi:parvulin-like peptidyl-prolyl isomerase